MNYASCCQATGTLHGAHGGVEPAARDAAATPRPASPTYTHATHKIRQTVSVRSVAVTASFDFLSLQMVTHTFLLSQLFVPICKKRSPASRKRALFLFGTKPLASAYCMPPVLGVLALEHQNDSRNGGIATPAVLRRKTAVVVCFTHTARVEYFFSVHIL